MIICIDIGNTNIKYAIYDKDDLKMSFRVATDFKKTSDEYGEQLTGMLEAKGIFVKDVNGGIVSSVVPTLDYTIDKMCNLYLGIEPLHIAPGLKSGLNIRCDDAREVGADRIVNCVSAIVSYGEGTPMIVVDFGTATTFNVISANNGYTGELETARIPDSFRTDILGEIEDGGGMLVEDTDAAPVPFALMFQFEGDKRETRHVVYKCTAQRPTVESSTTDTEIEPQTETLEFTAQSVYSSALGTHIVKSKTTESTDSTVVSAWFTAVQLPTAASSATT